MIGDIVLIRDRSKLGDVNIAGQRAITGDYDAPSHTHVALLTGTYKGVHAMPAPEHVELTLTYELLSPEGEWAVWRHRVLSERIRSDEKLFSKFMWQAERYTGERYNNPVLQKEKEYHSFCSELIGKVYPKFGIHFPGKSKNLMPITIAKTVQGDPDWLEVTEEYRNALQGDPRYQRLYDSTNPEQVRKTRQALVAAKRASKDAALFGEAIEGLDRFGHWSIEKDEDGWQSWTREFSSKGAHLSNEAYEWLMLLTLDEVDDGFIEFIGTWHN